MLGPRDVTLHHIGRITAGARFGDSAFNHAFTAGTPDRYLDIVFFLKGLDDRTGVFWIQGRVQRKRAFFARFIDDTLIAIGALIHQNTCYRRFGRRLCLHQRQRGR